MADRVILGKHPVSGEYGLWVSKPGMSVLSTNPDDFLANTDTPLTRIMISGVITRLRLLSWSLSGTMLNGSFGQTVYHGLGYIPFFQMGPNIQCYMQSSQIYLKENDLVAASISFGTYSGGVYTYSAGRDYQQANMSGPPDTNTGTINTIVPDAINGVTLGTIPYVIYGHKWAAS